MMQTNMRTVGVRLSAGIAIAIALAFLLVPQIVRAQPAAQGADLLLNGGFEPFITPDGKYDYPIFVTPEGGGHVAEHWSPWWVNGPGVEDSVPEYDIAPNNRDPYRVHGGLAAQQIFRPNVLWKAGVFQTVTVPANANLQFSIWGHAWASFCRRNPKAGKEGEPDVFCNSRNSHEDAANPGVMKVGIDPTGGTDANSPNVIWSADRIAYDNFEQFVVTAKAKGTRVTVFTYTTFVYPAPINNVYWDDAALVTTDGSAAPPPAGTPVPPGNPTGQVLEANGVVNVRSGPGTTYSILGQIRPGIKYNIVGQNGQWYMINFNGQTGYVFGPLTTVTNGTVPDIPPGKGLEAKVTLNVRSGPGTGNPVIGVIYPGAVYLITGQQGDWYQIDYKGKPGWVYGPYTTLH
jgi:uncharacterized protein YraI